AIKRPDDEPAPDMSRQCVPEPPKFFDSEPEPPVQENESVDDFLAQFAIQKPDDTQPEPEQTEEDFLAQFAISAPPKEEPVPEPAKPPVIDDISAALETMQQNPVRPVSASAPEPEADDIMKMFNIGSQNNSVPQVSGVSAPAEYAVPEQSDEELSEWDIIANQLFGGEVSEPVQPKIPQTVSVPEPVKPDDLFDEPQYMKTPTGPKEMDELPSIDEILAEHSGKTETVHYGTPIPEQPVSAPVLEDIAPEPVRPVSAPVLEDIAPEPVRPVSAPVLEDIAPEPVQPVSKPASDDIAFENLYDERPVLEDIPEDEDDDELGFISEALEPKSPVIDDISAALSALNAVSAPVKTQPAASAPVPVQPTASAPIPVQPAAPMTIPVQPVSPMPIPVQPVAPAPIPYQAVSPVQPAGVVGQIMSVPQLTGYDAAGQPIYSYIQMQIQGYDMNGQPMLVPVAGQISGQNIPAANAPLTFNQTFNQNTRLRDAVAAAQEVPTSVKDMTPGQRIAAAEAAKGSPATANVSKIATNPHARSTSQAFISAISESKEYADKSLTETQGLQQRTVVLDSIEDVLSQLGDSSLKEKKAAEARARSVSVPQYDEYRPGAARKPYSSPSGTSSSPMPSAPTAPQRPLTKAEEKAMKKQAKIAAKFQKEMAKRK
ncbi:MAG: hypothetical protein K2J37_01315, partial [Ruminococcus sp.]|nr:hypothetical protein [Ruminococcus sp.]